MGISDIVSRVSRRPAARADRPRRCAVAEAVEQRRAALIAVAERVFCKRGYHDATMDDVAAAAGISKRTLYQLVQSKEELFTALLARHRKPFDFSVEVNGRAVEAVLHDMLKGWAHHVLSPSLIALLRLIMAEHIHGKTLSQLLDRESAKPCSDALQTYFALCRDQGCLVIADPEEAAQMLYGMAIGNIHIQLLLGLGKAPSRAELDARITRAIELFLAGAQPRGPTRQVGEAVAEG
ncbi:MAG: TetR/AcrR family transcriptional regulator [Acidiphilium sp.]|nr:TetR/AcrR family transcriptional regulator [Acidiphilium sp.]MDD4936652.1 TetR/AcrR family transcriptional regulator [Acidiphilium sp.]